MLGGGIGQPVASEEIDALRPIALLVLRRGAETSELLDVVHQAEELPLAVDLFSTAQREASEPLVVA